MKPWFKYLCIGLTFSTTIGYAEEEPKAEEIEIYHELLEVQSESHLLEVLAEGAKRKLPLPKNLKSLWANPALRATLLEGMDLKTCEDFKVFDAATFLKMSTTEQSVVLFRANNDETWKESKQVIALELAIYGKMNAWARNLILTHHKAIGSTQLIPEINQLQNKTDLEKQHLLKNKNTVSASDLSYKSGDSSLIVETKLSLFPKLSDGDRAKAVKSYQNLPDAIKIYAIPYFQESTLQDLIKKSQNNSIKAVALKALFDQKWVSGQAMRVLKSKSWSEAHVLYEYFCANPDRINAESFDKYWKASSDVGKTLLTAFLWQHPKKEVSKTLVEHLEKEKEKMIALKAMHALPAHSQSDWLKKHVAAKKWDDELRAIALDTLWEWKEVPNDEFYIRLFLDHGYRNGGPGVESLLKLVGLSKDRKAPKIIAGFFREVEEPIVEVDVAIEAAGWHGSKEFLRTLEKMERDGNDTEIVLWAIARCKGEDLPLPEMDDNGLNRVNPYFFSSSN